MDADAPAMLIRIAITFLASLLFGLERQRSHKPIGFGTFVFVSLGSCALSVTAISITSGTQNSPLALISGIVTGIGFLGAGALIKTTDHVFGFTTAASIWFFAIFGLIVGVGQYEIGLILYLLVWVVVFIDKTLEKKGIGSYQKKLEIVANKKITGEDIFDVVGTKRYKIVNMNVDRKSNKFSITLLVEGSKANINRIPGILSKTEWVESYKME
jgi:putative Mg2+ transporter-C (MgtC) family protein